MSKMTVRKASNRLALLLERKPEINQPGRLVNHLMDEMRLSNSERRNSGPIIETALDRLEERGVVILGKSGDNVYNSVLLVKNQAERRREAAEKEQQLAMQTARATHAKPVVSFSENGERKEAPVSEPMDIPEILQNLSEKVLERTAENKLLKEEIAAKDEEIQLQFEQIERAHVQVTESTQQLEEVSTKLESAQEHIRLQKRETAAAEERERQALARLGVVERELEEAQMEIEELRAKAERFSTEGLVEQIAKAMAS